jgi:hypothetical protein
LYLIEYRTDEEHEELYQVDVDLIEAQIEIKYERKLQKLEELYDRYSDFDVTSIHDIPYVDQSLLESRLESVEELEEAYEAKLEKRNDELKEQLDELLDKTDKLLEKTYKHKNRYDESDMREDSVETFRIKETLGKDLYQEMLSKKRKFGTTKMLPDRSSMHKRPLSRRN